MRAYVCLQSAPRWRVFAVDPRTAQGVARAMDGCTHTPQASAGRIYRPRNPRATALYRCASRHAPELKVAGRFGRHVEENVLARFLECGDPQYGFARIYCDQCRHGFILAFSCKARYFCPSCHQKRVLAYGDWVEANVLAPVPHRQYVCSPYRACCGRCSPAGARCWGSCATSSSACSHASMQAQGRVLEP